MQPERRALLAAQHDLVHGPYPPDDLAFLWSGDNKVVLCRDMVDEEYWEDLRACLAYTAVHHLEVGHSRPPRSIGDLVVRDAERIAEQIRRLVESEDDECPINVRVWGATPEVYDAVVALQHRMKRSLALEGPSAVDYWSVSAFDTKTHGRELLGLALARHGDPSVKVPLGFSVKGSPSASPIVRLALRLFDGAMVKPEAGSGGSGIVFVSDASDERVLKSVQRVLAVDGCVVEEYVATQNATPIGFNGIVHPDGQVAALGAVRQHIVDRHRFLGFEAGRGVLDPELLSKIAQVGSTIGKVLYEV